MAKTFGDKLRTLRINNNFGFNEFWKTAKISKVYLSAIENGSQIPPPPERQSKFLEIIETKGKISEKTLKCQNACDKITLYIQKWADTLLAIYREKVPAELPGDPIHHS